MTIKCSFRLALNKIHVNREPGAVPTHYNSQGQLMFHLVVQEETKYINFIQLPNPMPSLFEPVKDFIRLITRTEFVSLTFNTLYIDSRNHKVIFRPSMLPCYSYEFDLIEGDVYHLKKELADTCLSLGFLTLERLDLDAIDYLMDNGNYHAALDRLDTEKPVSAGGL